MKKKKGLIGTAGERARGSVQDYKFRVVASV
jgi:hypothetical protein